MSSIINNGIMESIRVCCGIQVGEITKFQGKNNIYNFISLYPLRKWKGCAERQEVMNNWLFGNHRLDE